MERRNEQEEFRVPDLNIDPNVDVIPSIINNRSPCEIIDDSTNIPCLSQNQQQSPHNNPQPSETNDSSQSESKENPPSSSSSVSHNQPKAAVVGDIPRPSLQGGVKAKAPAPPPVPSLQYLQEHGIDKVEGKVECKKCERSYDISYNVQEKFNEMKDFILKNKGSMHNRAPGEWTSTKLLTCALCGEEDSCKPVLENENLEKIDWLFLFAGKFLGNCTLDQLKFFCKNNKIHRTGAKDRLVFYSYFKLCSQLEPDCALFSLN